MEVVESMILNSSYPSANFAVLLGQKHGDVAIIIKGIFLFVDQLFLLHPQRWNPVLIILIMRVGKFQELLAFFLGSYQRNSIRLKSFFHLFY